MAKRPQFDDTTLLAALRDLPREQFRERLRAELLQEGSSTMCVAARLTVKGAASAIDFYTRHFGMKLRRTTDRPEQQYTLAFLGYGADDGNGEVGSAEIELTYNYGVEKYEMGGAFGHLAIGVPDVAAACDIAAKAGGTVTRPAGPVKFGTTIIAFVKDPDGYSIELVQRP